MARHGTLTRKDFEQVSADSADLLSAVQATISDKTLTRAQALSAVSLIYGNYVNALAAVLSRSNTTFDKRRFLAGALSPLHGGQVVELEQASNVVPLKP
jgi:hypothetical protein